MNEQDIIEFTRLLSEEKALLESELKSVGRHAAEMPDDWEAALDGENTETAELEGRAEEIVEFEDRNALETELAYRYRLVNEALGRIQRGTYGICRVCNTPIEKERLLVSAAADTCKTHRNN